MLVLFFFFFWGGGGGESLDGFLGFSIISLGCGKISLVRREIPISACQWYFFKILYRVDIVLLSGDFAAIPVECYTNNGPQEVFDEHRQHMDKILHEFAPLATKVYYIPGNVSL